MMFADVAILRGGRRVRGFGLNDPTDSQTQQIVSWLPPTMRADYQAGKNVYATAQPAIDLAATVASGGAPTEAEMIAGLAGLGTLIGGPVIGAALGAAGIAITGMEAVIQDLFQALGFYATSPTWDYIGYQRTCGPKGGCDTIPSSPTDPNNWISLNRIQDYGALYGLAWGPNPNALPGGRPTISGSVDVQKDGMVRQVLFELMSPQDRWAWENGSWQNNVYMPASYSGQDLSSYPQLSDFQVYYDKLLLKNLQYWANAYPFIDPRTLLVQAAQVWNQIRTPTMQGCYDASDDPKTVISRVLSGKWGDPNYGPNAPQLCINEGPIVQNVSPAAITRIAPTVTPPSRGARAAGAAPGKKALVATAAVGAVGVGGFAGYAAYNGLTWAQAWRRLTHWG